MSHNFVKRLFELAKCAKRLTLANGKWLRKPCWFLCVTLNLRRHVTSAKLFENCSQALWLRAILWFDLNIGVWCAWHILITSVKLFENPSLPCDERHIFPYLWISDVWTVYIYIRPCCYLLRGGSDITIHVHNYATFTALNFFILTH